MDILCIKSGKCIFLQLELPKTKVTYDIVLGIIYHGWKYTTLSDYIAFGMHYVVCIGIPYCHITMSFDHLVCFFDNLICLFLKHTRWLEFICNIVLTWTSFPSHITFLDSTFGLVWYGWNSNLCSHASHHYFCHNNYVPYSKDHSSE